MKTKKCDVPFNGVVLYDGGRVGGREGGSERARERKRERER
jgi:hypothetical protein